MFGAGTINPTNTSPFYLTLNGDSIVQGFTPQWNGSAMPVACTFNVLTMTLLAQSGGAADTISVTLVKNGQDTSLTCSKDSSGTINATTNCVDNIHPVSVAVGDTVGYHLTQSTAAPGVRIAIGARCN